MLRPFRGSADDIEEFWKKFQVVAKIQKWTTAKDRMAHLPLYLSGDAFSVSSELSKVGQRTKRSMPPTIFFYVAWRGQCEVWTKEETLSCCSANVVYAITYTACNAVYIGKTGCLLREQMNRHRHSVNHARSPGNLDMSLYRIVWLPPVSLKH